MSVKLLIDGHMARKGFPIQAQGPSTFCNSYGRTISRIQLRLQLQGCSDVCSGGRTKNSLHVDLDLTYTEEWAATVLSRFSGQFNFLNGYPMNLGAITCVMSDGTYSMATASF